MITCFHGDVTLKGSNMDVIGDYISITASLIDILNNTITTNQITAEEKLACELMSVMGVAFDSSKLSNRKAFYEVIEMIASVKRKVEYES